MDATHAAVRLTDRKALGDGSFKGVRIFSVGYIYTPKLWRGAPPNDL